MINDWNQTKHDLNYDGITEDEKLQYVLNDIWQKNNIDEKNRIEIFTGTIRKHNDFFFVEDIRSVFEYKTLLKNPYKSEFVSVIIECNPKDELKKIVFTPNCGRLFKENELLNIKEFYSFSELDLSDDADREKIIEAIVRSGSFAEYKDRLIKHEWGDTFWEYKKGKEEQNRIINELKNQKNEIENEINNKKDQLENLEKQNEALIEYKSQIEHECDEILRQGKEAQEAINRAKLLKYSYEILENTKDESKKPLDNSFLNDVFLDVLKGRLDYEYSNDLLIPFLMSLGTSQIITVFGDPGTGKTTFVSKMAKALGAKFTAISVQNNWTDSSDILGYYNPLDGGSYISTVFVDALIDAKNDWENYLYNSVESPLHIICLDEMNLARLEYYFAEFLSKLQLEQDDKNRVIRLLPKQVLDKLDQSDNQNNPLIRYKDFIIPPNVRFCGTINNDDTTNELSPKVIDRSFFIKIDIDDNVFKEDKKRKISDFIPESYFRIETSLPDNEKSYFDVFDSENNRFKRYACEMWQMIKKVNPNFDFKEFSEYIIITKILPALHKTEEYNYSQEKYPHAYEIYSKYIPESGNNYNYLGGQK